MSPEPNEKPTGKAVPMVCALCYTTENYYGRLYFPTDEEPPTCPNHKTPVVLVPVPMAKNPRG